VHNSGWVQSPGAAALADAAARPRLKQYVQGVVGAFAADPRILAWDLWNEPDNTNAGSYERLDLPNKIALVLDLLPQVFAWARAEHPTQPLTSGVWQGAWSGPAMSAMTRIQLDQSDIVTFHNYGWPEDFERRVKELEPLQRPLICTEFMARGAGSTFDTVLPIALHAKVGAIAWGLVNGKSQTDLPWDSWQRPYVTLAPTVWFHDVFHPDGWPYRVRETELSRTLTANTPLFPLATPQPEKHRAPPTPGNQDTQKREESSCTAIALQAGRFDRNAATPSLAPLPSSCCSLPSVATPPWARPLPPSRKPTSSPT
jgi:hypothetical protein